MPRQIVLLLLLLLRPMPAHAQCPDGSPPPCAGARRATRPTTPPAAERARRFLVLPFRNVTRAAEQEWLVEGSPILLADAIGRWQDLSVVSDERLYPALRRHGLEPGTVMELARVRRVAEETGGWTAITGEVLAIGGGVRVRARAYDVVTNRELVQVTAETRPGEDVRRAYSQIGNRLLGTVGLDSAGVNLEAATTVSLDAYRAYLRGVTHLRRGEAVRARDALLEATRLDTAFAQALMHLAVAQMAVSPADIFDLNSPAVRYVDRAAAVADRLPPRRRDVVRAMSDVVHGRLTAARGTLTRLIQTDSGDVDALEWLASLESVDALLVPAPGGGERPRGSMNTSLRLFKRALELDPSRHNMYSDLVVHFAQAAGFGAPIRGLRRELPSLGAMLMVRPERTYVMVYRDTIELVPQDSIATIPRDTLAAARRRALVAAGAWARRWRREAPDESDAHLWLSRVYDLEGHLDSALLALNRADSIGIETGIEVPAIRRMGLLRRLGRLREAHVIADSLWAAGVIIPIGPRTRSDALAEVLRALLVAGDWVRADSLVRAMADMFTAQAGRGLGETATIGMLAGDNDANILGARPNAAFVDSVLVLMRGPLPPRVARWLPPLIGLAARNSGPDSARARAALVGAIRSLTASGQNMRALLLMAGLDSTTRNAMQREPAIEAARAPIRAELLAVARRFRPGTAVVQGDSVTFEWIVEGGDTVTWNRKTTPPLRDEYAWHMIAGAWHTHTGIEGSFSATAEHGPLARLLEQATKSVLDTSTVERGPAAIMSAIASSRLVRAEASPGRLRIVVRHAPFADALRATRPATARFRFAPCPREGEGVERCADQEITIEYR